MNLWAGLIDRQQTGSGQRFVDDYKNTREVAVDLNEGKVIEGDANAGVTWLNVDQVEQRYLLAGYADATVAAYDVKVADEEGEAAQEHRPVFKVERTHPSVHRYATSCVAWYPVDTGLFVTGSFDQEVKVWDTNVVEVACQFQLAARVYGVGMSPLARTHALIAAASAQPQVQLCDPASGSFTHTLFGHREAVWALHWSLSSEWHLATGACDGQVRVWDIRQSGCMHIFDQHHTQKKPSSPTVGTGVRSNDSRHSQRKGKNAPRTDLPHATTAATSAKAHDGCVTAVVPTPNGLHWLTAGTDERVRLWDSMDYRNMLVNYKDTFNRSQKARQVAVSDDSRLLFHPSGSVIQVFDLLSGPQHKVLRGAHFDTINCCAWNAELQELYSGGNDCNIVVWAPKRPEQPVEEVEVHQEAAVMDADAWSDDD